MPNNVKKWFNLGSKLTEYLKDETSPIGQIKSKLGLGKGLKRDDDEKDKEQQWYANQ